MFMKIFTVLIISFNNIFTIPQNIKNDKITTQLVRNKRENNKIYDFEMRNLEKVRFYFSITLNNIVQVNILKGNNVNINAELPSELKNVRNFTFEFTEKLENNQSTQKEIKQLINTRGQEKTNFPNNHLFKLWIINKKIRIKAQGTNLNDFKDEKNNSINYVLEHTSNFEIEIKKDSTDIKLSTATINFDGNHKYNDVIDNLDYLMIHRGNFDKFNYSYLYWTPIFNFVDTLEKGYYKEFTIKNHGFKSESHFYHKTSTILPNSEIIDPTNATKIEVIKKIKKKN
ncbi:hypothetical protein [Spiroplasma endosymbiont of Agriotes lineatus]|uniref:hypothetical protein n=1 Tax=Spiroplasma endosymbiont of Agriotes lineatus TaxID=3077930 RepID=UPI0030D46F30